MSSVAPRRWQVLISHDPAAPLVAGLPTAVRSAFRAGKELKPDRIVISGADDAFLRKWSFQLRAAGVPTLGDKIGASALDARLPLLAIAPGFFPDENALAEFAAAADSARFSLDARRGSFAALRREPAALGAGSRALDEVLKKAFSEPAAGIEAGSFVDARSPEAAAAAADLLCSRLVKDSDGYIAQLDRKVSIAISRALLPFPVTPNHVTTAGLLLGVLGAWWLAAPTTLVQFYGALVLWFCCLLDGCDGEIARLKHLQSEAGAKYDLWADHFSHLATFVALPIGVARVHPGRDWTVPGVMLVAGFLLCGFWVWKLVLSVPEEQRGPRALIVERIASRDYVYLIVALTAIGRLDWFVWAAAVGSHVLWLSLLLVSPKAKTA